jgi:hypothetical protein
MQNSPALAGLLASTIQIASAVWAQGQRGFAQSLTQYVEEALWWKGLHESAAEKGLPLFVRTVCELLRPEMRHQR